MQQQHLFADDTFKNMSWQIDHGGRHLQITCLLRDEHSECGKASYNSVFQKTNNPDKKRKEPEKIFLRRGYENDKQTAEGMPCIISIRKKCKSEITTNTSRLQHSYMTTDISRCRDAETLEPQYVSEWECKTVQPLWEDSLTGPQNVKHSIAK